MNTSFHALIGGIEAVTHFLRTRDLVHPPGRVVTVQPPAPPVIEQALTMLAEVKLTFLEAEAVFMTNMANMEHIPGAAAANDVSAPVPQGQRTITGLEEADPAARAALLNDARVEWKYSYDAHCAAWVKALDDEALKLATAIYTLQLLAPEWSVLDRRLAGLMEDFKKAAEFLMGTGDGSVSLGSKFSPGSSSGG